ncbi:hypothetical protein K432DRAFT_377307 [Lepidopterella palustris CBS 459.81]|uniref:F-box domain-containing protein n=1 Tax=Lepidopterella palustris CBS 459.81 TaxID=1314670 RepID=A0A8E2ELP1_9PEZI|nr:hypothetical protein K432DRAFT_377307 [Lepidopterella palustris CBS 459.81]
MISATLDTVIPEILLQILQYIYNSSTAKEFVNTLVVCRRWKQFGYALLWTNIFVTSKTIQSFTNSLADTDEGTCKLIRSLSIQLDPVPPKTTWDRGGALPLLWGESYILDEGPEWLSDFLKEQTEGWRTAVRSLWKLSTVMRSRLSRLTTFSFRMEIHPPAFLNHRSASRLPQLMTIPSRLLQQVLLALPPSCTSLEFDTCALEAHGGTERLCSTVRGLLPQLHHLRLRLSHVCPNIVSPEYFCSSDSSSSSELVAPQLQTLTINIRPLPWIGPIVRSAAVECLLNGSPYEQSNEPSNLAHQTMMLLALQGAMKNKCFPNIEKIQLVNMATSPSTVRQHPHSQLILLKLFDFIANTATCIPLQPVFRRGVNLLRAGEVFQAFPDRENPEPRFGRLAALEQMVEGDIWITSRRGSRFPASFETSSFARHARFERAHSGICDEKGMAEAGLSLIGQERGHWTTPSILLGLGIRPSVSPTLMVTVEPLAISCPSL